MKVAITSLLVMIIVTSALPAVNLISIVSIPGDASVTVLWVSASEYNNAWFEIVRDSTTTVATIVGGGYRNIEGSYCFTDNSVQNGTTYCYTLCGVEGDGDRQCFDIEVCATPYSVSAPEHDSPIPVTCSLSSFPNPFNPATTISFSLPRTSDVSLAVYDVTGRKVVTLINQTMSAGEHHVAFDGSALPSGLYFARLSAGEMTRTQKMVLLK